MSEEPEQHPDDRAPESENDEPAIERPDSPDPETVVGTPDGDGPDDGEPTGTDPRRKWLIIGAVLGVVALLVLLTVLFDNGGDNDTDGDPATTTIARDVPTKVLPADQAEIATVKDSVDLVEVLAEAPAGWNDSTEAVRIDDANVVLGEPGPKAENLLPTIDEPIIGRYAVDDGWEFTNPGPYLPPQPMTFLIVERRDDWAKVLIPARPNHTEGYVRLDDVEVTTTEYRIEVSLTDTTLRAWNGDEMIAETKVVIGTPFSETPTGLFYVTDMVPYENPEGVYGPIALATNGYSEWMDEFDTGVPVVALHGTSRPEQVGQQISNGCIRVPNDIITMLADTVPQGTPVLITP